MAEEERVRQLLDRQAIEDVLTSYLDAVRRRDWEQVRACFVPGATADYGFDTDRTIEAQLELLKRGIDRFDVSTLLGSNCMIDLRAEGASSQMTALTAHQSPPGSGDRTRISTVRYVDEWVRSDDGVWRITSRTLDTLWRAWLDPRFDDRAGDHRHADEW